MSAALAAGAWAAAGAQAAGPNFTVDPPTVIFINELHYDNEGTDVDEGVEVVAPTGTDVSNLRLVFYNQGAPYLSATELGPAVGECSGYDVYVVLRAGLQNGANDGLALVDVEAETTLQLLSYEGSFEATEGIAAGLISTDIGVAETNSTPVGHSLQLGGFGGAYDDFVWSPPAPATFGACNNDQTLGAPPALIELVSFTAQRQGSMVELAWETALEIDNAGFNLYRASAEEGARVQLNEQLIAAAAPAGQGAAYAYVDAPGDGSHFYWLEDVDTQGATTLHGPVTVAVLTPEAGDARIFVPVVWR